MNKTKTAPTVEQLRKRAVQLSQHEGPKNWFERLAPEDRCTVLTLIEDRSLSAEAIAEALMEVKGYEEVTPEKIRKLRRRHTPKVG